MSVFSKKYWVSKGYTEEEAMYQISIRRPNNVNYYIHKGHTLEEAEQLVKQRQKSAAKIRNDIPIGERKKLSPRCIEFYLRKGLSLEEAEAAREKFQTTFSKEICIEKYGKEQGLKIWEDRQKKWQDTLSNKSDEEKDIINTKKVYWNFKTNDEIIDIKNKITDTLNTYWDSASLERKTEHGKQISKALIKTGYATPIEERDAFEEYRNKVNSVTKRFDLTLLENFDKRGSLSYHLDHKYSVYEGFKNNISHEIVGHICNLEMLYYVENTSKGEKCSVTLEQLLKDIEKYNKK